MNLPPGFEEIALDGQRQRQTSAENDQPQQRRNDGKVNGGGPAKAETQPKKPTLVELLDGPGATPADWWAGNGIQIGDVKDELIREVCERFVYVHGRPGAFMPLEAARSEPGYTKEDFHDLMCHRAGEALANRQQGVSRAALRSPALIKVASVTLKPGCKVLVNDGIGRQRPCFNLWRPGIAPKPGSVEPFMDLLRRTAGGDERAVDAFMKCAAHVYQRPLEKVTFAPILIAEPGFGKGTIARALMPVYGEGNCAEVGIGAFDERFTSAYFPSTFLFIDEVERAVLSREGARGARLRRLITEPVYDFERKGRDAVSLPNRCAVLMASNSIDAITVGEGERRLLVLAAKAKDKDHGDVIARVHNWMRDGGAAHLAYHLSTIDLAGFQPKAEPPMTAGKRAMMEASQGEIETVIRAAMEQKEDIWAKAVATWFGMLAWAKETVGKGAKPSELRRALRAIRAEPFGPVRPDPSSKRCVKVWIIRGAEAVKDLPDAYSLVENELRRRLIDPPAPEFAPFFPAEGTEP